MQAKIKTKKEIAKGTLLVEFDCSQDDVDFKAGQYFTVGLVDPPYTDEKGNRRYFSIVNSPKNKDVLTLATRISDSAFKRSLKEMPVGSVVDIGPISGKFVLPEDTSRPLAFIAGGIGITPFICMLRHIQEESLPYKVALIYSNRDRSSTAFLDELQDMAKKNPNFRLFLTMTDDPGWEGEKRLINAELIKDCIDDPKSCIFYVAGPPGMVKAISEVLSEVGVDRSQVVLENFAGYQS